MPLIRKKTSKRITTHKRQRIKHKIAEGKKKKRKEAKKNPQWKSKKKKDPGIPNNFPYKDEILAEIAEGRRQADEAKQRRKEEKKLNKETQNIDQDANITDNLIVTGSSSKAKPQDDAPLLLNPELPNLEAVLNRSNVFLCVLDARDPMSYRVSHLENLASQRKDVKLAFILNKIELVPKESAIAWLKYLRSLYPTFMFRSASAFLPRSPEDLKKGKAKESEDDALGCEPLLTFLSQCMADTDHVRVAVVGVTNVGKSSIINSLARKTAVPVYQYSVTAQAWATTTTRAYEVEIPRQGSNGCITLTDTPGLSFQNEKQHDDEVKIRDMLTRRRGRVDKVKNPLPLVEQILSRADTQDLMVHYNLPVFAQGDTNGFVIGVARTLGLIRKGGEVDYANAAKSVLRDWNTAKLPIYSEAPTLESQNSITLTDDDEKILSTLRSRKEIRKERGLEIEQRLVELNAGFLIEEDSDEDSVHPSGNVDEDDEGEGQDEVEEDESEDGVLDGEEPISRKRKVSQSTFRPSKKVAFATGPTDRGEKKATRKLKQQSGKKERAQKASSNTQAEVSEKESKASNDTSKAKAASKVQPKPKNIPSKPKQNADSNTYDFDQFFKKS
ncbi:hypothetical protein Clacol_001440 [Clathrus columnatus]|uniref:CP-type G domain-containing protein n=1 Tax=Clathrus columnatus TaxID=1419009 RepID=A0AAV5A5R0_9AGAM|nr:hypothetical protein Clacol_001440 [Clathrus columnatus]